MKSKKYFPTKKSTVLFLAHDVASPDYVRHLQSMDNAGCTVIASSIAARDLKDNHGLKSVIDLDIYRAPGYRKLGLENSPLPEAIVTGMVAPRTDEIVAKLVAAKVPVIDLIVIDATVTRERRDRLKENMEAPKMEIILDAIAPNLTGTIQQAIKAERLVTTQPVHTGLIADAIENDTFVSEDSEETANAIWNLCNGNSWSLINGVSQVVKDALSKLKVPAAKFLVEMGLMEEVKA